MSRERLCGRVFLLTLLVSLGLTAPTALEAQPVPQSSPNPGSSPARPGRFRLGPFYLNPSFRVGSIGLDTNVFYTAVERRSDISASGGPGLELVLPIKTDSRFYLKGTLDYLYFLRTTSQRSLNGGASTGLSLKGGRTRFSAEEGYSTRFGRPSFEVDDRIQQNSEQTSAELVRQLFWRMSLTLHGRRSRDETDPGQDYLGTDLQKTLSRREYVARGGLSYAITPKTSFVLDGERQWSRFALDVTRDATWDRFSAGLRTDATALIAGELLAGVRYFRPEAPTLAQTRTTWVGVGASWNASHKTRFPFRYARDRSYSAFSTPRGAPPTLRTEAISVGIERQFLGRIDVRLFARQFRSITDAPISVEIPDQGTVVAVRDDKAREYGGELAYVFRSRLRIGVAASYTDRNSTIPYFGIDGLIVGGTVRYTP